MQRSQRRRAAWRAAWRAARAAAEPAVSTPAHCSRTQPYSNHLSMSVIPKLDVDIPVITADLFSSGETPVVLQPGCATSPEESTMPIVLTLHCIQPSLQHQHCELCHLFQKHWGYKKSRIKQ